MRSAARGQKWKLDETQLSEKSFTLETAAAKRKQTLSSRRRRLGQPNATAEKNHNKHLLGRSQELVSRKPRVSKLHLDR